MDIETGGFSKEKNALCSVGALIVDQNLTVVDELYLLVGPHSRRGENEPASYKPDAMVVNGLTEEQLRKDGVSVGVVMGMLEGLFRKYEILAFIGHNAKMFDIPWLTEYMLRFGNGYKFNYVIDTLEMSRKRWTLPNYDLSRICQHLGIQNDNAHNALSDCRATLELYRRLI